MEDKARQTADLIVEAAKKHKAFDLVLLKLSDLTSLTDYFFICSCRSSRQVQAVAEDIILKVKKEGKKRSLGVEGMNQGQWVLIDYGDVIAHVFYEPVRQMYDLESLWNEAPRIEFETSMND